MAPVQLHLDSYERDLEKFERNLQKARDKAFKERGYQSSPTHAKLRTEFNQRNNGMLAYPWQVDVAEVLLLGLDCTIVAGTGAGKTMPFVMPLFADLQKIVVVISPLNALEEDQVACH
jgi:ATP-dependent helicase YprA (DUF1998 family)